ncbi:MAG: electron transport complex subunit RsxC [Zoogloeaceae bacterium]|jgi:electron transport complex protein RnfC|nr:electron transport complex subunit RsxC [Zoogloeaceae bacterium]
MRLFKFKGGVKPDTHKDASVQEPIACLPLLPLYVVPLHQSVGDVPRPLVQVGQKVLKGERIGDADGNFSSAVHAPTSGVVKAVEPRLLPHPSGLPALCVVIEADGEDRWTERAGLDWRNASADDIQDFLRDAGVVGLGGAVFPSHIKLDPNRSGHTGTLILNGAECEPWMTCDDALMREKAEIILRGGAILRRVLGAGRMLIGIEDNKPQAVAAMRAAAAKLDADDEGNTEILAVPTLYPTGSAKQLIRVLTGVEVPYGRRSQDFGMQCFNVATALSVYHALERGEPLISRIVTVTGNVERPRNYEALIGTPIEALLSLAGVKAGTDRFIMGGPMMGFTLPAISAPVVKATNCVIAANPALFPPPPPELPCIRCGACAESCPQELQPMELYWFARARNPDKAREYHLFDCTECGCCAYVCPSSIPLIDYARFAKSEIWAREREKAASDAARERFEFRTLREERDKTEKAARLAAKIAAAHQEAATSAAAPAPDDPKQALIAAALARAQAQKQAAQPKNIDQLSPATEARIRDIETQRGKARELANAPDTPPEEKN